MVMILSPHSFCQLELCKYNDNMVLARTIYKEGALLTQPSWFTQSFTAPSQQLQLLRYEFHPVILANQPPKNSTEIWDSPSNSWHPVPQHTSTKQGLLKAWGPLLITASTPKWPVKATLTVMTNYLTPFSVPSWSCDRKISPRLVSKPQVLI
jgi:hypothetical protein